MENNAARLKARSITWPNVLVPGGWKTLRQMFNISGYGLTLVAPDGTTLDTHLMNPSDVLVAMERFEKKSGSNTTLASKIKLDERAKKLLDARDVPKRLTLELKERASKEELLSLPDPLVAGDAAFVLSSSLSQDNNAPKYQIIFVRPVNGAPFMYVDRNRDGKFTADERVGFQMMDTKKFPPNVFPANMVMGNARFSLPVSGGATRQVGCGYTRVPPQPEAATKEGATPSMPSGEHLTIFDAPSRVS